MSSSVVAVLIFFVVIAGLTVRARITGRQDSQYVLVNRASTGPSRTVYRLNGLGSRDLDPGCSAVALAFPG